MRASLAKSTLAIDCIQLNLQMFQSDAQSITITGLFNNH